MPLEGSFDNIDDLNPAWPTGADPKSEGDNHIAGIKNALKANVLGDGLVTQLLAAANVGFEIAADSQYLVLQPLATSGVIGARKDDGTELFQITGDEAGPGVTIRAMVIGRDLLLATTDALNAAQSHIVGDADTGRTRVMYQSQPHLETDAFGAHLQGETDEARLDLRAQSNGAQQAAFGVDLSVPGLTGKTAVLYTTDGVTGLQPALIASQAQTVLLANGTVRAATDADGLQVFSDLKFLAGLGGVLYGQIAATAFGVSMEAGANGLACLATAAGNSAGVVTDGSGASQPVGFNTMPQRETSVSTTVVPTDNGGCIRVQTGGFNITVNASSLPDDGVCVIMNPGNAPVTLVQSGVQFQWYTGAGLDQSGNRTLAAGAVCTIKQRPGTLAIELWGNGIS